MSQRIGNAMILLCHANIPELADWARPLSQEHVRDWAGPDHPETRYSGHQFTHSGFAFRRERP